MVQSYVRLLLLSSVCAIVFGAAANFVVDPYGLYRTVERDGFNKHKPKAGPNGELVKPYRVQMVRPRTLVLGNSRVEAGIDPDSPHWPAAARPAYNMALPATSIDAALLSVQHVMQAGKLEMVVVGVDFFDFVVSDKPGAARPPPQPLSDFEKRLLANRDGSPNAQYPLQRLKDGVSTLFSLNALVDSVQTVVLQNRGDQPDLTDRGFNPMREFQRFVRVDGQHVLFRQVETTYLTNYLRAPRAIYHAGTNTSKELDDLRAIIGLCRNSGIRLILYIHPYHAHMLESYRITGLWPLFEEWKRAVVRIVDEDAAAHPGARPADLWDFSGYNEITSEAVPAASEKGKAMQWYWEAGHYKREVGEFVLDRILGAGRPGGTAPADFGVKLSEHNIDSHLRAIRAARVRYEAARRDEVAALEDLAQTIRARTSRTR